MEKLCLNGLDMAKREKYLKAILCPCIGWHGDVFVYVSNVGDVTIHFDVQVLEKHLNETLKYFIKEVIEQKVHEAYESYMKKFRKFIGIFKYGVTINDDPFYRKEI